jgi:hypothetical protein
MGTFSRARFPQTQEERRAGRTGGEITIPLDRSRDAPCDANAGRWPRPVNVGPLSRMAKTITIHIAGNSPHCGEIPFPDGVTLGEVFDRIGGSPREQFRPSHTLVVRRWHNVEPHSITMPLSEAGWREFALLDKDHVIYQYDVEPVEDAR